MLAEPLPKRPLGQSEIMVSPVAMGCWPIAGMTSLDVNDQDSLATLRAAYDAGVNFFDTAYCYGAQGESERLIATALGPVRDQCVIATKAGIHWDSDGQRHQDARPETIRNQLHESLQRLGTDRVELLYLHAPDPQTPVAESAVAFRELQQQGKARLIGVSNCNVQQLQEFHEVCPILVVQPHYNMLQREIEQDILPWCQQRNISLAVYWPLLKGLLAGKLPRDHQFKPGDGRAKYPMFQGEQWQRNQDLVDELRQLAESLQISVTQLVVGWTLQQAGITAALCGAKRAYQIEESAAAMRVQLEPAEMAAIAEMLQRRGKPESRGAV